MIRPHIVASSSQLLLPTESSQEVQDLWSGLAAGPEGFFPSLSCHVWIVCPQAWPFSSAAQALSRVASVEVELLGILTEKVVMRALATGLLKLKP